MGFNCFSNSGAATGAFRIQAFRGSLEFLLGVGGFPTAGMEAAYGENSATTE